jgi:nicotinamidase-related amidase
MVPGVMSRGAVLVVDVQAGLVAGAYREAEVLGAITRTIEQIRASDGLVVFIQHCHATFPPLMKGNPGWALHEALAPRPEDRCVEKQASDAFHETHLDALLTEAGITRVYVTGLQSEYCVDATCRAALSRGYDVTLVSDAHTTGDSHLPAAEVVEHHNIVLGNLAHPTRSIEVAASISLSGAV